MISAVIFDLDGTLVETERLKAISYAKAACDIRPGFVTADEVIAAFTDMVGLTREDVAQRLVERFDLEQAACRRLAEFGVAKSWQVLVKIRLGYYRAMLRDRRLMHANRWLHNIELLHDMRRRGLKTALATMSYRDHVDMILDVLGLAGAFDVIAARDDVVQPKPYPEIFISVAARLGALPRECLVIEDSPTGVRAAVAAGMRCVAVTTPLTRDAMHIQNPVDKRFIVDEPEMLFSIVEGIIAAENEAS